MPQVHQVSCPKCIELWREYAEATREHVRLLKEQEKAIGTDPAHFQDLEDDVELAAMRRDSARAGICAHLADHTEQPAMTKTAGG